MDWDKEPTKFRSADPNAALLLCHFCDETVLTILGYDAAQFAKNTRGRIICEACEKQIRDHEVVPLRVFQREIAK